jgi:hypothetical protein
MSKSFIKFKKKNWLISYRHLGWYPGAFFNNRANTRSNLIPFINQSTLTSPLNLSWTTYYHQFWYPLLWGIKWGICLLASRPKRILLPFACQPRSSSLLYPPLHYYCYYVKGKKSWHQSPNTIVAWTTLLQL